MLDCLIADGAEVDARPVWPVAESDYQRWLAGQPEHVRAWLEATGFRAKPQQVALLPDPAGGLAGAVLIMGEPAEIWDFAALRAALPPGDWRLDRQPDDLDPEQAITGWALAGYRFDRYRSSAGDAKPVRLAVPDDDAARCASAIVGAVHLARDLINTPANDMGPAELADAVRGVAAAFGAMVEVILGDDLLERNFPAIHAVGRASDRAPRLIDMTFGDPQAPKVTLIGKGVCFDTGGLDLKPANAMLLMKKDMGGAAVTLGLAQAIMALDLPVRLRLLIGAVDNNVSGSAFRPGDVLKTRKGLSVEIGNTDAEGRLVLADLLALGDEEEPELMIDCATLTGAARVALGADLAALYTPDDMLAEDLHAAGQEVDDLVWRMPLHAPYRELIDSPIADINNAGSSGMAGSITAALFLKDFVGRARSWAHLDIYGWQPSSRPGRPKGGEANALRALLAAIRLRFEHIG